MGRLNDRVAWVTGGGRGIGRAIALGLAADGAAVAISARTRGELDRVAAQVRALGGRALAVQADAMSLADTLAAVQAIADELGPVDILVNNAGGGTGIAHADDLSPEQRDAALFAANVDLNLFSAYRASRAVMDGMVARGYGRIINIGSGYAKRSGGGAAYTAAKHGLIGLTRAMAAEVATKGVTVNCLCPGWTNTQLVNVAAMAQARGTDAASMRAVIESDNLQRRILEPEELAPMAALLAAPESAGITGQVISVDGGYKV